MGLLIDSDLSYLRATIDAMLPDTCTILSEALSPDGQGGQTSTWGTVSQNVACRLDEAAQTGGNTLVPAGGALREAHRYMLSLPYATTINAHDRVEISSNTYNVISVNEDVSWHAVMRAVLELL